MSTSQLQHPQNVAIIGCGFLGRHLACRLAAAGHRVLGISKTGVWKRREGEDTTTQPPSEVEMRSIDLIECSLDQIKDALADYPIWVICYAPNGRSESREKLYLGVLDRLLDVVAATYARRVIYTSSTSALPDSDALVGDTPLDWPSSARGRLQRKAESLLTTRGTAMGCSWAILRLGGLYGPGRPIGTTFLAKHGNQLPGDGGERTNLVHRDDAAEAVIQTLARPHCHQRTLNICAPDHATRRELFSRLLAGGHLELTWESPQGSPRGKQVDSTAAEWLLDLRWRHPVHCIEK